MSRKPNDKSDYEIELPGVGSFVFARRTQGDKLTIRRLYVSLAGPVPAGGESEVDWAVDFLAYFYASYTVLMVSCPAGWENILEMDGDDDAITAHHWTLGRMLGDKEGSFRQKPSGGSSGSGPGALENNGVLGAEEAQPRAK